MVYVTLSGHHIGLSARRYNTRVRVAHISTTSVGEFRRRNSRMVASDDELRSMSDSTVCKIVPVKQPTMGLIANQVTEVAG